VLASALPQLKLTYKILGHETEDLIAILKQLAPEIGVNHIAYIRMAAKKSIEGAMLTSGVVTYPKEWQQRYFTKSYSLIDPL
jgi:Autoinducer binding domain